MNESQPAIESAVLMPCIGDDVLFQTNGVKLTSPPLTILSEESPLHAKVVYVWNHAMVNLMVWDHYGNPHKMTSVKFLPPGEDVQPGQPYCELPVVPGELIVSEAAMPAVTDLQEEKAIVQAGADKAPRVTPFDIEAQIRSEFFFTASDGVLGESEMGTRPAAWTNLDQVTICVLILRNGTKVVGVNEGPVSRENFSAEIGRKYARQKAVDQVWPMLGYELRSKLAAD